MISVVMSVSGLTRFHCIVRKDGCTLILLPLRSSQDRYTRSVSPRIHKTFISNHVNITFNIINDVLQISSNQQHPKTICHTVVTGVVILKGCLPSMLTMLLLERRSTVRWMKEDTPTMRTR